VSSNIGRSAACASSATGPRQPRPRAGSLPSTKSGSAGILRCVASTGPRANGERKSFSEADAAVAGWYPEPDDEGRHPWGLRWWDGGQWTRDLFWWDGRRWRRVGTARSQVALARLRKPGQAVVVGGSVTLVASIGSLFVGQALFGWTVSGFLPLAVISRSLLAMARASESNRQVGRLPTTLPRPPKQAGATAVEDPAEPWRHSELSANAAMSCCLCTNPRSPTPRRHLSLDVIWPGGGTRQARDAHETCVRAQIKLGAADADCAVCGQPSHPSTAFRLHISGVGHSLRLSVHEACAKQRLLRTA
jgi:hypothetical protein